MTRPTIVNAICTSLLSPYQPCRKLAAEMLIFFCSFDEESPDRKGLGMVLVAFDYVEQTLNSAIADVSNKVGKFDMWLRQLEATIDGRGRMGSMVGMSKDFKESIHVQEYCVSHVRDIADARISCSTSLSSCRPAINYGLGVPSALNWNHQASSPYSTRSGHGGIQTSPS
jgi:hypothetical protein